MADPIINNAANEEQLNEAKQKQRFREQRRENAWKAVMATEQGMEVLMEILAFSKLEANPMGGADREIFYRIGRQDVGRFVKSEMIEADRKKYFEAELNLGDQKR